MPAPANLHPHLVTPEERVKGALEKLFDGQTKRGQLGWPERYHLGILTSPEATAYFAEAADELDAGVIDPEGALQALVDSAAAESLAMVDDKAGNYAMMQAKQEAITRLVGQLDGRELLFALNLLTAKFEDAPAGAKSERWLSRLGKKVKNGLGMAALYLGVVEGYVPRKAPGSTTLLGRMGDALRPNFFFDGDPRSQEQRLRDFLATEVRNTVLDMEARAPGTPVDPESVRASKLGELMGVARKRFAELEAKRASRGFRGGPSGLYEAETAYKLLRGVVGEERLEAEISAEIIGGDNAAAVNQRATELVLEEMATYRKEMIGAISDKRVSRVIDWFNKGGFLKRAAKSAVIGLSAGALAAVTAVTAPVAVAGGLAAGVAFAGRVARGYVRGKAKLQLSDQEVRQREGTVVEAASGASTAEEVIERATRRVNKLQEDDVQDLRRQKRQRLGGMALSVALGGAAGYGIGSALRWAGEYGSGLGGSQGTAGATLQQSPQPQSGATPASTILKHELPTRGGGTLAPETLAPSPEEAPAPSVGPAPDAAGNELSDQHAAGSNKALDQQSAGGFPATESFSYSYHAAPEELLKEVGLKQLGGVNLSDTDAYKLTNYLMRETNGEIFEGVKMEWHVLGQDARIVNPGGETAGLTKKAKALAEEWLRLKAHK